MNYSGLFRATFVGAACFGLILPPQIAPAAEPQPSENVLARITVPAITDVALGEGGLLVGAIVNTEGAPIAGMPVALRQNAQEIAAAQTDARGGFAITGLRGGVYQVVAGKDTRFYRLWAPRTAPPSAVDGVTIAAQHDMVRGQLEPHPLLVGMSRLKCCLTNPLVVGGIIAAAVAIPVAVHNRDKQEGPPAS